MPNTNLIWIQGENAVKASFVPNGGKVVFFDSELPVIYIKSVDASGKPEITILDYTERGSNEKNIPSPVDETVAIEYATKEQVDNLNTQILNTEAIEEISVASLVLFVCIANTTQIHFSHSFLHDDVNAPFQLIILYVPEMREVVHQAIGYYPQRDGFPNFFRNLHETIDGIVESGVTSHYNQRFVSIVDHHFDQPVNTTGILALYEVIIDPFVFQTFLHFFPFGIWSESTTFRAKNYSPLVAVV